MRRPFVSQIGQDQEQIQISVIKFDSIGATDLLGRYASCYQGTSPGDGYRLVIKFWELPNILDGWDFFQGPPDGATQVCTAGGSKLFIVES